MSEWNVRVEEAGGEPEGRDLSLQPQGGQGGSPSTGTRQVVGRHRGRPPPDYGQATQRGSGEKSGLDQAAAPVTGRGDPGHSAGGSGTPGNTQPTLS